MRIAVNKDIEAAYKDEFFKGFTLRETLHIAAAFAIVAGVTFALYKFAGLSLSVGVYLGAPLGFPVIYIGFKRFQGLTLGEYMKEKSYRKKTAVLLYDADELPDGRELFTMGRSGTKRARRKRRKKNAGEK